MNRLVRGVERSGCLLLRSRRLGFSTAKSSSVVGAQNLIVHTNPTSSNNYDRRISFIASTPNNIDRFILGRNLSSMSAAVATDTSSDDNFEQDESNSTTMIERKPSALEQANLDASEGALGADVVVPQTVRPQK